MSVAETEKIVLVGFKKTRDAFLKELMAKGCVEINTFQKTKSLYRESLADKKTETEEKINQAKKAVKNLGLYGKEKSPLIAERKEISYFDFENADCEKAFEVIEKINSLAEKIDSAKGKISKSKSLIAALSPWRELESDISVKKTQRTEFFMGTINAKTDFFDVLKEAEKEVPNLFLNQAGEDKQFKYVYALCFKEDAERLKAVLKKFGFSALSFARKGTPKEIIGECNEKISSLKREIETDISFISSLKSHKRDMELFCDRNNQRLGMINAVSDMCHSKKLFFLEGWVLVNKKGELKELTEKYGYYFEKIEPYEDENPPVLLENSALVSPFEVITAMYSYPSKKDIDPTKFLAPFYFLFFGLMLGDAAYGLIISALCFFAIKKYDLEGTKQKLIKMFFLCGISTFMWGVLFGSRFGDIVAVFSKMFLGREITIPPLWFEPINDPMKLLVFSLVLGACHIFMAMALRAYMLIRDKKGFDAFCDVGLWYFLLIGIVLYAINGAALGLWMTLFGALGIIFTGGRHKKGVLGKAVGGFASLYGITNYLSDVLSYSRLLALGLATGVVSSVVNLLGSLMGNGFLGFLTLTVVFIVGHSFNLLINALGAFVHSCRLQYVEFFGKFYTGGGRPFKPFMNNTEFFKIVKEGK